MYHTLYMKKVHSLKGRYLEESFLEILEVSLGEISTYANFEIKIQKYEY